MLDKIIASGRTVCIVFLWGHLFVWPVGCILQTWGFLPELPMDQIMTTDFLLCVLAVSYLSVTTLFWQQADPRALLKMAYSKIDYLEAELLRYNPDLEGSIRKSWDY